MPVSPVLVTIVKNKRRKALKTYAFFALLLLGTASFALLFPSLNTYAGVIFFSAVWLIIGTLVHKKMGLGGAFSSFKTGTVAGNYTDEEYSKSTGTPMSLRIVGVLLVKVEGKMRPRKVRLRSHLYLDLYKEGDEILYSRALAAPLLLNRRAEKMACPACASIFPTGDSITGEDDTWDTVVLDTVTCPFCDASFELPREPEEDEFF